MAARPRGGDWLEDDLSSWKRSGADSVLSLLTPEEEKDLDLRQEGGEAKWSDVLEKVMRTLSEGKNVVVHCQQGIGRSGLVAACVLVRKGVSPGAAVEMVSAARGVSVPETTEQRDWIDHYAVALSATK